MSATDASRLGWLLDGTSAPPLPAMYLEADGQPLVQLSWLRESDIAGSAPWVLDGVEVHNAATGRPQVHRPPDPLWFQDSKGVITIAGPRVSSWSHSNRGGRATLRARYAVHDTGGGDYRAVNGLRSEIGGLLLWLGQNPLEWQEQRPDGQGTGPRVDLHDLPPVQVSKRMNLRIVPSWDSSFPSRDEVHVRQWAYVETNIARARPLFEHLDLHIAVRDLMRVAFWQEIGFAQQLAHRRDDPERLLSGAEAGPRWASVAAPFVTSRAAAPEWSTMMFSLADLGSTGLRRWLRLHRDFARGIRPLLATLDTANAGAEAKLTLSSIGLDGIGYQLALDDGVGSNRADKQTHRARLLRIVKDLAVSLPFDPPEWATRSAAVYSGAKHANRTMPDYLSILNTRRENCLVGRLWIATRLGVPPRVLTRFLSHTEMVQPYVRLGADG